MRVAWGNKGEESLCIAPSLPPRAPRAAPPPPNRREGGDVERVRLSYRARMWRLSAPQLLASGLLYGFCAADAPILTH